VRNNNRATNASGSVNFWIASGAFDVVAFVAA